MLLVTICIFEILFTPTGTDLGGPFRGINVANEILKLAVISPWAGADSRGWNTGDISPKTIKKKKKKRSEKKKKRRDGRKTTTNF